MRGDDQRTGNLFAYVNIEERIRPNHPLRPIKALVDNSKAKKPTREPGALQMMPRRNLNVLKKTSTMLWKGMVRQNSRIFPEMFLALVR